MEYTPSEKYFRLSTAINPEVCIGSMSPGDIVETCFAVEEPLGCKLREITEDEFQKGLETN